MIEKAKGIERERRRKKGIRRGGGRKGLANEEENPTHHLFLAIHFLFI